VTGRAHIGRAFAALLVLTAVLLGALAAGTPVNGDDSVAAQTAGINLSTTHPVMAKAASTIADRTSSILGRLALLLSLLSFAVVVAEAQLRTSTLPRHSQSRRGPPVLA
jgi:hypothetical protein